MEDSRLVPISMEPDKLSYKEMVDAAIGFTLTEGSPAAPLRSLFTGDADRLQSAYADGTTNNVFCWICGGKISDKEIKNSGNRGESDHLLPVTSLFQSGVATKLYNIDDLITRGFNGKHALIQPACSLCNGVKSDTSLLDTIFVKSTADKKTIYAIGKSSDLTAVKQRIDPIGPASRQTIKILFDRICRAATSTEYIRGYGIEHFGYENKDEHTSKKEKNDWTNSRVERMYTMMTELAEKLTGENAAFINSSHDERHNDRRMHLLTSVLNTYENLGPEFIHNLLNNENVVYKGMQFTNDKTLDTTSYSTYVLSDYLLLSLNSILDDDIRNVIEDAIKIERNKLEKMEFTETDCPVFKPIIMEAFNAVNYALCEKINGPSIIEQILAQMKQGERSNEYIMQKVVFDIMKLIYLNIINLDENFKKYLTSHPSSNNTRKVKLEKIFELAVVVMCKELKNSYGIPVVKKIVEMLLCIFQDNRFFGFSYKEKIPISEIIAKMLFPNESITPKIQYAIITNGKPENNSNNSNNKLKFMPESVIQNTTYGPISEWILQGLQELKKEDINDDTVYDLIQDMITSKTP